MNRSNKECFYTISYSKVIFMKNIIYSATRQWNPGDEFILMGVESLIQEVFGSHNSILYNRNPQIRPDFSSIKRKKYPYL